jgi:hypothetical protein
VFSFDAVSWTGQKKSLDDGCMMRNMTWCGGLGLAAIGLALAVGCQGGGDRPATHPVSGQVTLGGTPVEGAIVSFVPTGEGGNAASGTTDASGNYTLSTFASGDGAVAGEYGVKVVKYEGQQQQAAGSGSEEETDASGYPASYGGAAPEGQDEGPAANRLPPKYANPSTSGFTATVQAGNNTFDFPLKQ